MSKTTTFEAWTCLRNDDWIRPMPSYLFHRERDARGWAIANNKTDRPPITPVRVRVTVEVIEEGLTIPEAMDA